jgi:hypothetical protein
VAATSKAYDVTAIRQGPGDLWIIGSPPDNSTVRLALTSGTPDSVTHANSICLGLTEGPIKVTFKDKLSEIRVDQADGPVGVYKEQVEAMIEAELTQQSVDLLQQALTTGTYSTASGYKQLTIGGVSEVPTAAFAVITPKLGGGGLYTVSLIYKGYVEGLLEASSGRAKKSTHKITIKGLTDLARTAGKQIGVHYETT